MNVRVYPNPNSSPVSGNASTTNRNQTGSETPTLNPSHMVGNTVDTVDQVSSVTLLGFAVTGAALVVLTQAVIG